MLNKITAPAPIVATIVRGSGFWQHPIAVKNALCEDGRRRAVRLNQDGETGRCTVGKKTLKGFITYVPDSYETVGQYDYKFIVWN